MPESPDIQRCGIYLRVSTEQQVDRQSLSTQESQLLEYAKLRGWTVTKAFTDAGHSAKDTHRPALQQMLQWARDGKLDVVLVSKVDRISRNLVDLLNLIDDLNSWHVDFVAASQNFDTSTPVGRLSFNMVGSFAQFEREMIAERVRENMHERAKGGVWSGGKPPFGYRANEATKQLEVVEAEAQVVRDIFTDFLGHRSVRHTVIAMNAAGKRNRGGKHWARTSILRILRAPTYIGTLCYGKRALRGRKLVARDRDDWVVTENAHPAIVGKADFERVQAILSGNSRPGSWQDSSPHLLSGLARCASCGSRIIGMRFERELKGGTTQYCYYRCIGHIQKGRSFCEGVSYRTADLDAAIVGQLVGFDADELCGQLKAYQRRAGAESGKLTRRRDELARQYENLTQRERKVLELYEEDIIDLAIYKQRHGQLELQRRGVAQELSELEAQMPGNGLSGVDPQALAAQFSELQETFQYLNLREQQRLLRAMTRGITVHADGRVEVKFNLVAGLQVTGVPIHEHRVVAVDGERPSEVTKRCRAAAASEVSAAG